MSKPSGTLPFMNAMTDEKNNALMQTDAMLRGNSSDPQIQPYVTPDATRLQRKPTYDTSTPLGQAAARAPYLVESGADPEIMTPFIPSATTFPQSRPPSVGGGAASNYGEGYITPAIPNISATPPGYGASTTASVDATPPGYGASTTASVDAIPPGYGASTIPSVTSPSLPTGLGNKTIPSIQTYNAGQSNQATAWQNLPDANLDQAYELNEMYSKTGGTTVDNYAVGAVTDGSSQGVYANADGYALRDANNRVVFRNDAYDVPVVRTTVVEKIKGEGTYKPATNFDPSQASINSTNANLSVTPSRKNELSPTSKAMIGTDASNGDPNMAGAVWYNQPGTNVLTRKFPTASERAKETREAEQKKESVRKAKEETARMLRESKDKKEAETARKNAEAKARREASERQARERQETARKNAEAKARKEAEDRKRRLEASKKKAEAKARATAAREKAEKARKEAEDRKRRLEASKKKAEAKARATAAREKAEKARVAKAKAEKAQAAREKAIRDAQAASAAAAARRRKKRSDDNKSSVSQRKESASKKYGGLHSGGR